MASGKSTWRKPPVRKITTKSATRKVKKQPPYPAIIPAGQGE